MSNVPPDSPVSSLVPQPSPHSAVPPPIPLPVLEYAGRETSWWRRRPIIIILAGIASFFLGSVGAAFNWYMRQDTQAIYAEVAKPKRPPAPMPAAPSLTPYDGEYVAPGGLRFAERNVVVEHIRSHVALSPDREEMLHRFLWEYGWRIVGTSSGPVTPEMLRGAVRNIRIETSRIDTSTVHPFAVVADTDGGKLIVGNNVAGLLRQGQQSLTTEWGVKPAHLEPARVLPAWRVQDEIDQFRKMNLNPMQAAQLAALVRERGKQLDTEALVYSGRWVIPGTFECNVDPGRGESKNWILRNGALVPIRGGTANLDPKTGQVLPPPLVVTGSTVAAGYLVLDSWMAIAFSLLLVGVSVTIMADWAHARELMVVYAVARLVTIFAGLVMGLWFTASVEGRSTMAQNLAGSQAVVRISIWCLLGSMWPAMLLIIARLPHVRTYYAERGVGAGSWLGAANGVIRGPLVHPAVGWSLIGLSLAAGIGHIIFGLIARGEPILMAVAGVIATAVVGSFLLVKGRKAQRTSRLPPGAASLVLLAGLLTPLDAVGQATQSVTIGGVAQSADFRPQDREALPPADNEWIMGQIESVRSLPEQKRTEFIRSAVVAREGGAELLLRMIRDGDDYDRTLALRVFGTTGELRNQVATSDLAKRYQAVLDDFVAKLCSRGGANSDQRQVIYWFGVENGMLNAIGEKAKTAHGSAYYAVIEAVDEYELRRQQQVKQRPLSPQDEAALRDFWIAAAEDARIGQEVIYHVARGLARHAPDTTPLAFKLLESDNVLAQTIAALALIQASADGGPSAQVVDAFIKVYPKIRHGQGIMDVSHALATSAPQQLITMLPTFTGAHLQRACEALERDNSALVPVMVCALLKSDSSEAHTLAQRYVSSAALADADLYALVTQLAASDDPKQRVLGLTALDRAYLLGPVGRQEYARLNSGQDGFGRPLHPHTFPVPRVQPKPWPPQPVADDAAGKPTALQQNARLWSAWIWVIWMMAVLPASVVHLIYRTAAQKRV